MASSGDRFEIITDPITAAVRFFLQNTAGEAFTFLWDQTGGTLFSMILLSSKADDLRRETRYLIDQRKEILDEINRGTIGNKRPTHPAETWLKEADKVEIDERKFQGSFTQSSCCFPWLYIFLARDMQKLLKEVLRLKTQGAHLTVLCEATPSTVLLQSTSTYPITGMESIFSEIRGWLFDEDDSEIIGIYGMGGVGKTTLLKAINNELRRAESDRFDLVIFVTVSKEVSIDRIQKEIGKRLGYESYFDDQCKDERATKLLNDLCERKFILLLDDLWAKLDLGEVGVPVSSISRKGSKIAFTTRFTKVCNDMGAADRKVKVPFLSDESSWELFCKSMGKREDKMAESIRPLAVAVAKKCGGLPLAIIVVGRAMADAATVGEWEEALRALADVVEDMKDEVLTTLKYSLDKLNDESHKECLLYCSLFSEDYNIPVSDLIDYWVGEGFFENARYPLSLRSSRNRGYIAVSALKAACLLEDGEWEDSVKLHDVVREMALCITSGDREKERSIFLVNCGEGLDRVPMPKRWTNATRISLMQNRISELPEIPRCENLRTLSLQNNCLRQIHNEFFSFTPFLTVLDLSSTGIEFLPNEIGFLVELRFLNLSRTPLKSLPKELGRLKRLKILYLRHMYHLEGIPKAVISPISCLQSLKVEGSYLAWWRGWKRDDVSSMDRGICLKLLNGLTQLEELDTITIRCQEDWRDLSASHKLCSIIKQLELCYLAGISSIDLSRDFWSPKELITLFIDKCLHLDQLIFPAYQIMKLENLTLRKLPLERISFNHGNKLVRNPAKGGACFQNLRELLIVSCDKLQEITWVQELPCLEFLYILYCDKMVEIIRKEESDMNGIVEERDPSFPRLRHISLKNMYNLMSMSTQTSLFPSLQEVHVRSCPKLKRLPFGYLSAKNIRRIEGEIGWWDALEWSDPSIRLNFTPYFEATDKQDDASACEPTNNEPTDELDGAPTDEPIDEPSDELDDSSRDEPTDDGPNDELNDSLTDKPTDEMLLERMSLLMMSLLMMSLETKS